MFADVTPPRAKARNVHASPRGRGWIVVLLAACVPLGAAQARIERPDTVPAGCAGTDAPRSLLVRGACDDRTGFTGYLDSVPDLPLVNIRVAAMAGSEFTASFPRFDLAALRSRPLLSALTVPPAATLAEEPEVELAPPMIVGAASTYDPTDPGDKFAGGMETANGETYDPEGWTAAVQVALRHRFGGVRYRMKYELTYALVEVGDKRAIVRINDVGPLRPGRVIDLNRRAMRFFDPTMKRGVIQGVRVSVLEGRHWVLGPVDGNENEAQPVAVAQAALPAN